VSPVGVAVDRVADEREGPAEEAERDGPVDGALDAVARLADPELAVGLLEGRPRSPTGQN
jgi:phosphoglycolate phosphatase-like HAD superfamily hydrolase